MGRGTIAMPKLFGSSNLTEVRAVIGSEKKEFFEDPEVIEAFADHGFEVNVDTAGSRRIATDVDLSPYDFAFPSSAPAAQKISDGVVSADYPLSTITGSDQGEQVAELAGWFAEHPDALTDTYRRPTTANATLPAELSSQTIIEAPFPGSKTVTDALIDAYTNQFRVPGETTFVLDVSGSMLGQRITLLKDTMSDLISGGATTDLANVSLRDREKVSIIPFSFGPHEVISETLGAVGSPSRTDLQQRVEALQADGGTGIYDAVLAAYAESAGGDYIPSIVLMTDGELTAGRTYDQFLTEWNALPSNIRSIPVFVILYGEANVADMEQLAATTGGETFDAINGDLDEAFKEIRAYQ
ncbi:hypothetical protein SB89_07235 [Corynebacterium glutamicum]|nr:VWA domain-containing protein [Corynebacterium glutamicum]AJE68767.1 hypothetical protein SB89_07235 [Corynebacterium glutamicum]OKX93430.1 hypothetical protein AUP72_05270 [Corynebacterium glutamicum]TWS38892.1 hypothetical protein AKJ21_04175 [Corynebacterium glutamicum]